MKAKTMRKFTCDSLMLIRPTIAKTVAKPAPRAPSLATKARLLFPRPMRSSDEVNQANRDFWAKHK